MSLFLQGNLLWSLILGMFPLLLHFAYIPSHSVSFETTIYCSLEGYLYVGSIPA